MLRNAINPPLDSGVPIEFAKSLLSTGPQERMFLQKEFTPQNRSCWGLAPRMAEMRLKIIINSVFWALESIAHITWRFSAFLFKSHFLRVQTFTSFFIFLNETGF